MQLIKNINLGKYIPEMCATLSVGNLNILVIKVVRSLHCRRF